MVDYKLIRQYFKGKGSEEELKLIEEWFVNLASEKELTEVSHELWNEITEDISIRGFDETRILEKINYFLRLEEAETYNKNRVKNMLIKYLTSIAAVLFIPLILFTLIYWKGGVGSKKAISYSEIYSPLGARTNFILPDGSKGWLNGGSYLGFPNGFKGKHKEVKLSGEAYFEVKTNPKMSFIVVTEEIKIRAYGTSFNVKAYPDDQNINITLESGDIEIFGDDDNGRERSIGKLIPGERGDIVKRTNLFSVKKVNVSKDISWKDGKLVLRNEPFAEAVKKINRWYNVKIIIKDKKLETFNYRATFVDETLDEVMRLLQFTSPIKVKELGRERHPDGTYGKRIIEIYNYPDH